MKSCRPLAWSWCCVVLACLAGCDNSPQRVPVSGQVLIDGVPVTRGFVRVLPDGGAAAFGQIQADGRFKLTSKVPDDGCLPGEHLVEVVATEPVNGTSQRRLVPRQYQSAAESQLKINIPGPTDNLVIKLTWEGSGKKGPYVETFGKE